MENKNCQKNNISKMDIKINAYKHTESGNPKLTNT